MSQNSQENTCVRVFFNKVTCSACNFIKKETLAKVFSCDIFKNFKNTFFTEHLSTTASAFFVSSRESLRVSDWHKALKLNLSELKKSHKGTLMQIWKRPYIFKIR